MPTMAIIGAGQGLGAAVARRFAQEGFSIGLISRNAERVEALAEELGAEGITARGYTANVRDRQSIVDALEQVSADLGPVEVLQFSPLPQKEFLRPVLESTADDIAAAVEFSVYGPVTAVHQVLQHMRVLGGGTVIFVNGGTAVKPLPKFAGTSIAFAGQSAYAEIMHEAVKDDGVHVAQIIIPGAIEEGHERKDPKVLAETIWSMHADKGEFRTFADDM